MSARVALSLALFFNAVMAFTFSHDHAVRVLAAISGACALITLAILAVIEWGRES